MVSSAGHAADLEHIGTFKWSYPNDDFGGISGLWISDDGSQLEAVSDRGHFVVGSITRQDGVISDVQVSQFAPLIGRDNADLSGILVDAEGLARSSDGKRFVSFEGNPRVWRYDTLASRPEWTHKWDRFWKLQRNSGLEALAIDADDTLYAVPERSGAWERPFPVYRLKNGTWDDAIKLDRSGKFLVVGADFGPDGALYLLERTFEWLGGFRTRIRKFELADSGVSTGVVLFESRLGQFDNLEGIATWIDDTGRTRLTLVSDDNFSIFQSTQLVEFVVVPDPAPAASEG